jgi:hypothetical protein
MNNTTPYSRTMSGLTDIVANSITTDTLVLDSLTAQDIVCNTLSAASYVDTPLLQGSGNLNMTYVGGIYSNSPEYNIDTTGGYGGIALTSQFDVDLQPITGKINLTGKVNQSTGTRNVSYGLNSMNGTQTGSDNTSFGNGSSQVVTSGAYNTSLGSLSLNSNIISNNNVAIGYNALNKVTTGNNTAVGAQALANLTTANATTAVGYNALNALTTGTSNTACGLRVLEFCNGDANTGMGQQASRYLTTGLHNTATGFAADYLNLTGSFNTIYGSASGCISSSFGTGFNGNSCFGYSVNTSGGSLNSYFGFGANYVSPISTNNSTGIGAYATPTASNQIMLGTATEYVQCPNFLNAVNYITTATQTAGTNNTRVATTAFVQTAVSNNNTTLLSSANAWTGNTNTFNSFLPTSTLAPTTGNQLTNKTYVDGAIAGITGVATLSGANAFTGNTNTFNSFLPTSTILATTANQLTNKTYVDNAITAGIIQTSLTIRYWSDEFLNGLSGNGETPLFPWTASTTGTVAMTGASTASIAGHMGIWRISSTGTAAANRGYILRQTTAGWFMSDIKSFEYVFNITHGGVKCNYSVNCGLTNAAFTQIVVLRYIRDGATGLNPSNEVEIGFNGTYTYLTGSNIWLGGLSNWVSFAVTDIDTAGNLTIVLKNFTGGTSYTTTYAGGTGFLANTGQQGIFQFSDTLVSPVMTYTCDLDYFQLGVQQARN